MVEGVLDIKLVPAWHAPSIVPPLKSSLSRCAWLQGAVAFWTVSDSFFSNRIAHALRDGNSFMCVDLHLPTDIDALAGLVKSGAQFWLLCEDIPTQSEFGKKEPPYLLHPKVLLFYFRDGTAELWVGSHNWTRRALWGLNVEYSVVLTLRQDSRLFFDVLEYLRWIKSVCTVFEIGNVEIYRQLQRSREERTVPVIDVEAVGAHDLSGLEISIFGTDQQDLKELGTVHRQAYLSATENDFSEKIHIYPARIMQTGELNSGIAGAGTVEFSPRRYAFRRGRRFPELLAKCEVSASTMAAARYYVTLQLGGADDSLEFDYPRGRRVDWGRVGENQSPLIRRLGEEERFVLFGAERPSVRVPTEVQDVKSDYLALPLNERRLLQEVSFVSRRILRRT
jgi:hypothetical protein